MGALRLSFDASLAFRSFACVGHMCRWSISIPTPTWTNRWWKRSIERCPTGLTNVSSPIATPMQTVETPRSAQGQPPTTPTCHTPESTDPLVWVGDARRAHPTWHGNKDDGTPPSSRTSEDAPHGGKQAMGKRRRCIRKKTRPQKDIADRSCGRSKNFNESLCLPSHDHGHHTTHVHPSYIHRPTSRRSRFIRNATIYSCKPNRTNSASDATFQRRDVRLRRHLFLITLETASCNPWMVKKGKGDS